MPNPKAGTFKDSFATETVSPCWAVDGSAHGAGPGLVLGPNSDIFNNSDNYDLTESAVWAQWAALPSDGQARLVAVLGIDDGGCTTRIAYKPSFSPARLQFISFFDPVFGPEPSLANPPYVNYTGAENAFKIGLSGNTLAWYTSDDGGATWDLRRQLILTSPQLAAFANVGVELVSNGADSNGVVASFNGGGTPHCPADPAPPPIAAPGLEQVYWYRDAKGFLYPVRVWLIVADAGDPAVTGANLKSALDGCTRAVLQRADGPYQIAPIGPRWGSATDAVSSPDHGIVTAVAGGTGQCVRLVIPAIKPTLILPDGTLDFDGAKPLLAAATYWSTHCGSSQGAPLTSVIGGYFTRGRMRRTFSPITRNPTLTAGGQ